jgi:tetratricopeptide (TPR) repeat protein
LIKKNRLFKQALDYYSHSEDLTKKIKLAFGEYLHQRGYSEEAGFLYSAAGEFQLAMTAFKKCLNVEMCFALATQGSLSEDSKEELKEELVERLKNANRYEVNFFTL